LRRECADDESRREQRCERNLALAAERRPADKRGERPEAEVRGRQGVRGKEERHAENLFRATHRSNEPASAEAPAVRCRGCRTGG